jgi:Second Messenger Oligonucleotide or Dinucleotide Synthetase domain
MLTIHSPLHKRLSTFVEWIRTDADREDTIRNQADEIRSRVKSQATKDDLTIASMPWGGSFAKRTGLRRHMLGKTPIEGQDVDLHFVISPARKRDEELESLLERFAGYLEASYPETVREPTKSSVKLRFKGTKLSYDVVLLLATKDARRQLLIRANGERRETSVQDHIDFVKGRTGASQEQKGRVQFNEMVRLFKWWREVQCQGDVSLYNTMIIDLLCAHAFDNCGVETTYPATLAKWFGLLANVVRTRAPVYFSDFRAWSRPPSFSPWSVVDPVNPDNNVASQLGKLDVDTLASWLEDGRDALLQAISAALDEDETGAITALVPLFGGHIVNNS